MCFIFSLEDFRKWVGKTIKEGLLENEGIIFCLYPKKGNKEYETWIGRDELIPSVNMDEDGYVDDSPLKFNTMLSFNDTFTAIGLKWVEKRKAVKKISQCVGDYADKIDELRAELASQPDVQEKYDKLTPGYKRGWARFVYAARNEDTIKKHLQQMIEILNTGYKSIDLYRADKKRK